MVYALTVKYTLGSSNYQSSSSHGNSSTNMGTERGELLWDRERERIKKKEKEKEIAAKMAVRLILKLKPCSVLGLSSEASDVKSLYHVCFPVDSFGVRQEIN